MPWTARTDAGRGAGTGRGRRSREAGSRRVLTALGTAVRARPVPLALDAALTVCGVGFAVWRLAPTLTSVPHLASRLAHLQWAWVTVAVVLSVSSLLSYGELHRRLLRAGGCGLAGRTVQAVTVVGNAVTLTVPSAGSAAGSAYAVAALRRRGVELATALWVVTVGGLASTAAVLLVAPTALAAAGLLEHWEAAALSASIAGIVAAGWLLVRRPRSVVVAARTVLGFARGLPVMRRTRIIGRAERAVSGLADRVARLRPTPRQGLGWMAVALGGWLLDYAALAGFLAATVGSVPWAAAAVGYLAVQASIALQLTPGGSGPAEAGLLAALVGGGVPAGDAAIVVVTYRSVSWLLLASAGWVMFGAGALRARGRRLR